MSSLLVYTPDWTLGTQKEDEWIKSMVNCMAGAMLSVLGGFYDLGCSLEKQLTVSGAGVEWSEHVLGRKLAGLLGRALNHDQQGKGIYFQLSERNQKTTALPGSSKEYL